MPESFDPLCSWLPRTVPIQAVGEWRRQRMEFEPESTDILLRQSQRASRNPTYMDTKVGWAIGLMLKKVI